jgi:predicted ATPase/class 3 adenylate cyclase
VVQGSSSVTTVLFTDIAGSTRLWAEQPERMKSALARHDAISRATVESHRGIVVKTTGDGIHAAFDDPLNAVASALEIQIVLSEPESTSGILLPVRCGLHVGVVEHRDDDVFGISVNRAARIMSAAHPGQVLLSRPVAELISDRLLPDVALRDLGSVRLRDLSSPEHLFQLVHPRLRQDFPALRSLESLPNNLPQQLTSFIGRGHELAELKESLARTRLLVLRGVGGIGKTRLALQFAAEAMDDYPDGVWFVDLAPITDPQLVAKAIAQALGVREVGSESLAQTLCSHLKPMRALLILDNCEHLVDACATLIDAMLRASPTLRVLATSREVLHVAGEQTYQLGALSLPDANGDLDSLSRSEAAQLFVERARLQQQGFALTAQRAPAIAELCLRLDGIPLALELAAARVALLPVEKIVERLNDRFRLLTSGSRSALPRQQTLRALIEWSFDLLAQTERTAFARLAAFAGGWTLEAAEAVVPGDGISQEDVLDLLSSLVDKSLVVVENNVERYRMLETIRQYAQERLRASGEEPAVRERHFAYYSALAERLEPAVLGGAGQKEALDALEADHDNLRSALTWALETPERGDLALRTSGSVYRFWLHRGYWQEGYAWCMKALAQAPEASDKSLHAKALLGAGTLGGNLPKEDRRDLFEDALQLSREAGDRKTEAIALNSTAQMLDWKNIDVRLARSLLEQAREINRETGNKTLELHNMSNLVNVLRVQDEHEAALDLAEEGLASSRTSGGPLDEAVFLYMLALIARDRGDMAAAERFNKQSLDISRELRTPDWQSFVLLELSVLAIVCGDATPGRHYLTEALDISRKIGDQQNMAECIAAAGALASHVGHDEKAARLWGMAEALLGSYLPIDRVDRRLIAQYRSRCREILGDAAYDAAAAAGRALSREAAIDEALAWLRR